MDINILRSQIDIFDNEIIETLAKRFKMIEEIAQFKKENNLNSLQPWRWQELIDSRKKQATDLWIDPEMIEEIWNIIHKFALKKQDLILKN
ncbi:MAG: Phospho-2-dehydro-3-deoxyheptonate aldolase/chorismate mutase [uncultured bacterium (gcode 4)]|uniref:Phospho-2-dehydro-3-deoxyheptonate aldolase/chorismate mutase n=1 Tax=uncultured bacterium (gcode 4) TaxID=1234023 RepID=K2G7Z1_9BACT|nr:MAG: Phospho-2-dehydro-3-deoxyheptonate aldolase/chorismate mutase [uncultured bacterium (gcode 4)]